MTAGWPAPVPVSHDAAKLSRHGNDLLAGLAASAPSAASEGGAGQRLLEVLAQLAVVVQSAEPGGVRRHTGWWGRLLGQDVERELDAREWQPRLGVLLAQAAAAAQALRVQCDGRAAARAHAAGAAQALQEWADAAGAQLPSLSPVLQAVLEPRIDHLRRLAALQQVEAGQWQLLGEQDAALLARSQRITETLLPAWRQAALARRAGDQQQRNQQAAQLLAQISAELDAAQARLD